MVGFRLESFTNAGFGQPLSRRQEASEPLCLLTGGGEIRIRLVPRYSIIGDPWDQGQERKKKRTATDSQELAVFIVGGVRSV